MQAEIAAVLPSRHTRVVVSGISGCISLACWIIVFTPQIYENWRRKSSEGLSVGFVILWLVGDVFNVLGAMLQRVLPTIILLALYYTLADIVLLWQVEHYKCVSHAPHELPASSEDAALIGQHKGKKRSIVNQIGIVILVVLLGVTGYFVGDRQKNEPPASDQPFSIWGQLFGWICAFLYLGSRVPQIMLNYRRKSTNGVSILFFVFAVIGNITYCISIFAADSSPRQLLINASWILGAAGSLCLDLFIFFQFWVYNK